jgi:FKBP-type peptidyl-prolyl cis-trans isomerase
MIRLPLLLGVALLGAAACSDEGPAGGEMAGENPAAAPDSACTPPSFDVDETVAIVDGLDATLLKRGYGRRAIAGDMVRVHYTGWLFDPDAPDNLGEKFDSSVDRDEAFEFPLGARRVIAGWDQGVECMLIGEKRLLKIAPDLAYGSRGAGGVIPPDSTLLFEVELLGALGPDENP